MYRKVLLIFAAIMGAAVIVAPSGASARGRGGRGRGFGWGGAAIGLGLGLGAAGYYGGYGYGPGYYGAGYPAYGGCWRRAVVDTPYGPRARRIWVCD